MRAFFALRTSGVLRCVPVGPGSVFPSWSRPLTFVAGSAVGPGRMPRIHEEEDGMMEKLHHKQVIEELARVRDDLTRNGQLDLAERIDQVRDRLLRRSREGQPISVGELLNAIMLVVAIISLFR